MMFQNKFSPRSNTSPKYQGPPVKNNFVTPHQRGSNQSNYSKAEILKPE